MAGSARPILWIVCGLLLPLDTQAHADDAGWVPAGPSVGPQQINGLVVDPHDDQVIYISGPKTIHRSKDAGQTWAPLPQAPACNRLAVAPQDSRVLFVAGPQGLYRSTDVGVSWTLMLEKNDLQVLAFDPADPQTLYTGGGSGLFRSTDGANTWAQVNPNLVVDLAVHPKNGALFLAGTKALWVSLDKGATWEQRRAIAFDLLVLDPADPERLWAVAMGSLTNVIGHSVDGGHNWTYSGQGIVQPNRPKIGGYYTLAADPQDNQILYTLTGVGAFRSLDGGATWAILDSTSATAGTLAIDPQHPERLYVGRELDGYVTHSLSLRRSGDHGQTWESLPLNPVALCLAADPRDPQTLYLGTDQGLYQSTDAGQHWALHSHQPIFGEVQVDPTDSRRLYGGGKGLWVSEDQGRTWAELAPLGGRTVSVLLRDPRSPDHFYAVAGGALFRSTDQGQTWAAGLAGLVVRTLVAGPPDTGLLFAGTRDGVYRSADLGATWTALTTPADTYALTMGTQPPYPLYTSITGVRQSWVYRSEDLGDTWALSTPLPSLRSGVEGPIPPNPVDIRTDPRDSRVIYVATEWDRVFRSPDGGETWEPSNADLPGTRSALPALDWYARLPRLFLSVPGKPLFYACEWGLFRHDLPPVPVQEPDEETPLPAPAGPWTTTGPRALLYGAFPLGLAVSTLTLDPGPPFTLYAGAPDGQVYRRDTAGNWSLANTGLPGTAILTLAVDPRDGEHLYAGLAGRPAVYQTHDRGQHWQSASGNSLFGAVHALAFDPTDSNTLYGGMNGYLVKTQNGGQSWRKLLQLQTRFVSLAVDPVQPQRVYAGAQNPREYGQSSEAAWLGGVYQSDDGGAHWTRILEADIAQVVLDAVDPLLLYARTDQGKVFRSDNQGEQWAKLDTGLQGAPVQALAVDPQQSGVGYALTATGDLCRYTASRGWEPIAAGLPRDGVTVLAAVADRGASVLFANTRLGVYGSDALTPAPLGPLPLPTTEAGPPVWRPTRITGPIRTIAFAPSQPQVVYAAKDQDLYRKVGEGPWQLQAANGVTDFTAGSGIGVSSGFLLIDPLDAEVLYSNGVRQSRDGGQTWTKVTLHRETITGLAAALDPHNPQTLYVGGTGFLHRSSDGGQSWEREQVFEEVVFVDLAVDPGEPQTVYAASARGVIGGIFRSRDSGRTWGAVAYGDGRQVLVDWHTPGHLYALITGELYHSPDQGDHWQAGSALPAGTPITALTLDWRTPGVLYAGTQGKVYRSTDQGATWSLFGTGLPDLAIFELAVDPLQPQRVYAGTLTGLYATGDTTSIPPPPSQPDTTSTDPDSVGSPTHPALPDTAADPDTQPPAEETPAAALPPAFTSLAPPYPNPFNRSTTLGYQLAERCRVELRVYDLRGVLVRALQDGNQDLGYYRLDWDGSSGEGQPLATGVYLIRFRAGSYTALAKALLIR